MDISLKPKKVTLFLSLIVGFLTLANIIVQVLWLHFGHDHIYGLFPLFNVRGEGNLPSTYSSLSLLFCSALLAIITSAKKKDGDPYTPYWFGLAVIFLFLSIDEAAAVHELLIRPIRSALNTSGLLFFAWVIPYGILLFLFVILYLRFLAGLPARMRWLFITAGLVFVSGAIGFEIFGAPLAEAGLRGSLSYAVLISIEELLEMVGIVIFIYALTSYIDSEFKEVLIKITSSRTPNNC
jgi:hypothetical protein